MPTNRFFNYKPEQYRSQFVPNKLPLEEMGKGLQAQQKEFDTSLAGAESAEDELQVEGPDLINQYSKGLPRQVQKQKQQEYNQKIDKVQEGLQSGEISPRKAALQVKEIKDQFQKDPEVRTLKQMKETEKKMQEDYRDLRSSGDQPLRENQFQAWGQNILEDKQIKDNPYLGVEALQDIGGKAKSIVGSIDDTKVVREGFEAYSKAGPGELGLVDKKIASKGVSPDKFNKVIKGKVDAFLNTSEGKQFVKKLNYQGINDEKEVREKTKKLLASAARDEMGTTLDKIIYSRPDLGEDGSGGGIYGGEDDYMVREGDSFQDQVKEEFGGTDVEAIRSAIDYYGNKKGDKGRADYFKDKLNKHRKEFMNMDPSQLKEFGANMPSEGETWKKSMQIYDKIEPALKNPEKVIKDKGERTLNAKEIAPEDQTSKEKAYSREHWQNEAREANKVMATLIKEGKSVKEAKKIAKDQEQRDQIIERVNNLQNEKERFDESFNKYISKKDILTDRKLVPTDVDQGFEDAYSNMFLGSNVEDIRIMESETGFSDETLENNSRNWKIAGDYVPRFIKPHQRNNNKGEIEVQVYNDNEYNPDEKGGKNNPIAVRVRPKTSPSVTGEGGNDFYSTLVKETGSEKLKRQIGLSKKFGHAKYNDRGEKRIKSPFTGSSISIQSRNGKFTPKYNGEEIDRADAFGAFRQGGNHREATQVMDEIKEELPGDVQRSWGDPGQLSTILMGIADSGTSDEQVKEMIGGDNPERELKLIKKAASVDYKAESEAEAEDVSTVLDIMESNQRERSRY